MNNNRHVYKIRLKESMNIIKRRKVIKIILYINIRYSFQPKLLSVKLFLSSRNHTMYFTTGWKRISVIWGRGNVGSMK